VETVLLWYVDGASLFLSAPVKGEESSQAKTKKKSGVKEGGREANPTAGTADLLAIITCYKGTSSWVAREGIKANSSPNGLQCICRAL
jgi:hypothetical protein